MKSEIKLIKGAIDSYESLIKTATQTEIDDYNKLRKDNQKQYFWLFSGLLAFVFSLFFPDLQKSIGIILIAIGIPTAATLGSIRQAIEKQEKLLDKEINTLKKLKNVIIGELNSFRTSIERSHNMSILETKLSMTYEYAKEKINLYIVKEIITKDSFEIIWFGLEQLFPSVEEEERE